MKKETRFINRVQVAMCILVLLTNIQLSNAQVSDTTLQGFCPYKFGAAVSVPLLKTNATYRAIVAKEYNSLTPENAMKFGVIHPQQNTYFWTDADTLVNFAQQYGKRVHGHTLVWHQNIPSWVTNFVGDSVAWENIFKTHIQTVVTHYKGKCSSWDVVNEVIDDNGVMRNSIWKQKLGSNYILRAFQYAHQADTSALLFYNDYAHESNTPKWTAIKALINTLIAQGAPIDGVGFQMHQSKNVDNNNINNIIDTILAKNLIVHIAELDISMNPENNLSKTYTATVASQQFSKYKYLARRVNAIAPNKFYGITTWNVTDKDSWIPGFFGRPDWPLPFDSNYQRKLAYQGIKDGASTEWDFDSSSCQSFAGTYTDLSTNGTAITTNSAGSAMTYDDDNSSIQNIGFTFNYNGTKYSQFVLNSNGYIKLGAAPSTDHYYYSGYNGTSGSAITASDIDIIYPYNHDLKSGTGTPEYRVYTSGSAGSKVCTIQFKNVADKTTPQQFNNINFQIKLYEQTGAIEFVYGPWYASANAEAAITSACGIKGISNKESVNVAKLSSIAWGTTMTTPTNYDFSEGNYPAAGPQFNTKKSILPTSGWTYRFKPNTISVEVNADSYLRDGTYGDTNYGNDTALMLKKDATVGFTRIDYIKFKIPSQAMGTISNLQLQLYMNYANTDAATTDWQVYKVSNNTWTETGITYNNRPAYGSLLSTIDGSTALGYKYWDVTNGLTNDTLSLALVSTVTGANTNVNFASKQSAVAEYRPKLIVSSGSGAEARNAVQPVIIAFNKEEITSMVVYPNPANNTIHISMNKLDEGMQLQLFSPTGQLLQSRRMTKSNEQLDVANYTAGQYYLQIICNGKLVSTQKIMIVH
jgi:endo-1,4-beta-xylanase